MRRRPDFLTRAPFAAAVTLGVFATSLHAQSQPSLAGVEGMDYDTLVICSVVYDAASRLADDNDNPDLGNEFRNASRAYGASGLHMLSYRMTSLEDAIAYSEARMPEIVASLQSRATQDPDGEEGVVSDWVPYCDALGPSVTRALTQRDQQGW